MGFEWTLMRSFLAVMDRGSLLAAARHLGSTQPTIGRHVAALEKQLGVPLFERTGRGLVPTALARELVGPARSMDAGAAAIERRLSGAGTQVAGSVRLAASTTVAAFLLPALVARLRVEEPGIEIEIVASNALSNLLRREADIALRMVRPRQSSLVTRRLPDVEMGAFASRAYLQRRGMPRVPADLLSHDLIGYDTDETLLRGFRAVTGRPVDRSLFKVRTDDFVVVWQSIRAGAGIGFTTGYLAGSDPAVLRVLPQLAIPPLPLWLTVHREIRASPRIRRVYDFLAEQVPAELARRSAS